MFHAKFAVTVLLFLKVTLLWSCSSDLPDLQERNAAETEATRAAPLIRSGLYPNKAGYPLLPLLRGAKKSIDIEIYQMREPVVQEELLAAARRGVRVRIVAEENPVADKCDAFGSYNNKRQKCEGEEFVTKLKSLGGSVVYFHSSLCGLDATKCYQHGKAVIVDSKYALISTGNFNGTNLCMPRAGKCNRDLSYVTLDKDIVKTISKVIENDLKAQRYDLVGIIESFGKNKVTVSPVSRSPILELIASATSSISLQAQYLKEPEINNALIEAAGRGVRVRATVSSLCSFGFPRKTELDKIVPIFEAFDAVSIGLSMFTKLNRIEGKSAYMHSKAILVDEARGWVGSINGSETSTLINREFGVFFSDRSSVKNMKTILARDFHSPFNEGWRSNTTCEKERAEPENAKRDL